MKTRVKTSGAVLNIGKALVENNGKHAYCSAATSVYAGKDDDGRAKFDPNWYQLVWLGEESVRRAKALELSPGMTVLVDGEIRIREYTGKQDGSRQKAIEIIVRDCEVVGHPKSKEADDDFDPNNYL